MKPSILGLGGLSVVGAGVASSYFYVSSHVQTGIIEKEEEKIEGLNLASSWKGPRFLSKHYFSSFEFSSKDGFITNFRESVDGLNPKVRGKYYIEWVNGSDSDWEDHVKNLNSRHDKSAVKAVLGKDDFSALDLKNVCDSLAKKELKAVGSNSQFKFESGGKTYGSLNDVEEWKNAVFVCTRTVSLGDYMKRAYLDANLIQGKEIITSASDISNEAIKLREDDEKTDQNSAVAYGKEYLQDRLRGLDDDEVREEIFGWCEYLSNKAAPTGTWNNDKDNFATYCMKTKGPSPVKIEIKVKQPKTVGEGGFGSVGEYFSKEYLDSGVFKGKKIVTSAREVSDSVWSLRQYDEENYEKSISLGKEFLFDRLKEKNLELVKEEVFKWCEFLKTRSFSETAKSRGLYHIQTYCLTDIK